MSLLRISALFILISTLTIGTVGAVTYPSSGPSGSYSGGLFGVYFQNLIDSPCPAGQTVTSFSTGSANYGEPICISAGLPAAVEGDTLRYNGTSWVANSTIYNDGAYVGIGTGLPQAALDVNGGVKIGTMAFCGLVTAGTLRYNEGPPAGVEYCDSSSWQPLGGAGWGLTGNAGTNSGTNFIGTTDAKDLIVKTNNTERMIIEAGGDIGIGTSSPSSKLHVVGTTRLDLGSDTAGQIYYRSSGGNLARLALGSAGQVLGVSSDAALEWKSPVSYFESGVWTLSGNTAGASDFIGTTNARDLIMKTNNTERVRISDTEGDIFIDTYTRIGNGAGNDTYSTYFGRASGQYTGTGLYNTSMGSYALQYIRGGSQNVAVGYSTLMDSYGDYNTAVGALALGYGARGSRNTALGYATLYNSNLISTSASDNTAVGYKAMHYNSSGASNTVVGASAGYGVGGANYSNNSFFGTQAGYGILSGDNNSFFGSNAGYTITAGGNNIFLGANAGDSFSSGTGNIVIGYDIDVPSTTASNTLNIGNIIFGTGIDGADSTLSSGNIGIGTSTPSEKLTVVGTGSFYGIKISSGASDGYVLTSDATGNARWAASAGGGGGWGLTGNAGTDPYGTSNNFLGTTDVQDLVVKTNDTARMTVYSGATVSGAIMTVVGGDMIVNGLTVGQGSAQAGNTVFGMNALTSNVTGFANTAIGNTALYQNTDGFSNIALGEQALYANIDGFNNLAIGNSTLSANTSGYQNMAIGQGAMTANLTGQNNTAIGQGAMLNNLTGQSNTAVGGLTLRDNTVGFENSAFGQSALYSNIDGSYNTAIGNLALYSNTGGDWNVALGNQALYYNEDGYQNVAIGVSTLFFNTGGAQNTAIGHDALGYNSTGFQNVANGGYSLYYNRTGSGNVAMGYEALYSATGVSYQTAVGYQALWNATTGTQNLALGYQAGSGITTGSNNIAIGYNAQVLSATESNQLSIGNWIYGSAGDIGIGTPSPSTKLHVVGSVRFDLGSDASGDMYYRDQGVLPFQLRRLALGSAGQFLSTNGLSPVWTTFTSSALSGAVWSLSGNTAGASDFIGTTNVRDLIVKTNNVERFRVYSGATTTAIVKITGGDVLIGNLTVGMGKTQANANTAVGYRALLNDTSFHITGGNAAFGSNALTANLGGTNNTAVGADALKANTTGAWNTANGVSAMSANITGGSNTANGARALATNTGGSYNVASGHFALNLTTGNGNIGIGYQSFSGNTTGTYNTALGYNAGGSGATLTNATAIGANAIVSASNSLVLGDSSVSVGIGTSAPGAKLEVNGGIRLNTVTAKPTCNESQRGTFWVTQGSFGVKDDVEVCAKDAIEAYAWRVIY